MKRLPTRSLAHWGILAVKAAKKIVQKIAFIYKDWHEMLPLALHEYCPVIHTSTGETSSFPQVYNMKVVLPVEVEVPTIGVLPKSKLD
ncbi:hypothetical protein MTR_2g046250 [Medicago truncatula]|uniref:Uncharacterized protein n=1 Tax=Medicago truncatula TaxID=3880 RepID=A0A072VHV0_MEDTR|nr:hypothetical protein MTR_2g046250 [Medicago truncatula]